MEDKQKIWKCSSTFCPEGIYEKKIYLRLLLRLPLTLQTLAQGLCHFSVAMETQRNKRQVHIVTAGGRYLTSYFPLNRQIPVIEVYYTSL